MNKLSSINKLWWGLILVSCVVSCKTTFNFTGVPAGGDDGLETIAIDLFGNQAPVIVPNLAQEFTQQLQDRFISQSRLTLIATDADVNVSGSITQYRISPVAISGDERAAQNRLTIGVKVTYENLVNPDDSWDQTFSSFVDFDSDLDFISIEQEKISEIVEQLTQDIFNKSLGKW